MNLLCILQYFHTVNSSLVDDDITVGFASRSLFSYHEQIEQIAVHITVLLSIFCRRITYSVQGSPENAQSFTYIGPNCRTICGRIALFVPKCTDYLLLKNTKISYMIICSSFK